MTPARRPEAAKRWLEEARERLDHARTYHGGSRRILCEQAHYHPSPRLSPADAHIVGTGRAGEHNKPDDGRRSAGPE